MITPKDTSTLLVIDVATSGFRPESGQILEVACILVDGAALEVVDVYTGVIKHDAVAVAGAPDFHGPLVDECVSSAEAHSLRATEGFLLAGPWTTASLIVNRAIDDFDMKWLAKHMPTLHKELCRPGKLHLDLRALERLHTARGAAPFVDANPRTFRAADDALSAYEELIHWSTNK